jgi:hypothetical protein
LRPGGGSDSGIRETRRTRRACVVANAGGFGILRGARGDRAAPDRASESGSRAGYGTPSVNAYLAWSLCERVCFLRAAAYRRTMDGSMSRDVRRGEPLLRRDAQSNPLRVCRNDERFPNGRSSSRTSRERRLSPNLSRAGRGATATRAGVCPGERASDG